mmetsp:Transcript_16732/g.34102  ORF Transcript_16732/g.34102 Transcript_16732/m.34102 type:complete len:228 (+) Transcript_16732:260-943(+)
MIWLVMLRTRLSLLKFLFLPNSDFDGFHSAENQPPSDDALRDENVGKSIDIVHLRIVAPPLSLNQSRRNFLTMHDITHQVRSHPVAAIYCLNVNDIGQSNSRRIKRNISPHDGLNHDNAIQVVDVRHSTEMTSHHPLNLHGAIIIQRQPLPDPPPAKHSLYGGGGEMVHFQPIPHPPSAKTALYFRGGKVVEWGEIVAERDLLSWRWWRWVFGGHGGSVRISIFETG